MWRWLGPALLLTLFAAEAAAQDGNWPGWRGDGSGISDATGIPADFRADGRTLWRTEIPGSGHSSPIVWDNQVIVTSSGGSAAMRRTEWWLGFAIAAAALVIVAGMLAAARAALPGRTPDQVPAGAGWFRWLGTLERAGAMALSVYFIDRLRVLNQEVAATFTPDTPHLTWIYSGELLVFGAIAAVGSFWAGSRMRVGAILTLAVAGYGFHLYQPRQTANLAVPIDWQYNVLKPLVIALAWFLVIELVARLARFRPPAGGLARLWPAGLVAALVLGFGYYNLLQPILGSRRLVVALDAESGEILWQQRVSAPTGRKYPTNSYATPTPATDGNVVVADFGPVMLGLDMKGSVLWEREEPGFLGHLRHGAAISPVLHDGLLYHAYYPEIQEAGEADPDWSFEERSYLAAFDAESGEEVWRVDGIPGGHDAFATPLIMDTAAGKAIVIVVNDNTHAYDAASGRHLWSFHSPVSVPVPSPVAGSDTLYMSGGLYGPTVLAAIQLGDDGVARSPTPAARWSTTRSTPEVSSPLLVDGLLYWVTQNGRIFCADVADGTILWRERLGGGVNASPIFADGKIIIPGADGDVFVVAAGREFELLATNKIGVPIFASAAVSGNRIFLRSENQVIAIGPRRQRG